MRAFIFEVKHIFLAAQENLWLENMIEMNVCNDPLIFTRAI